MPALTKKRPTEEVLVRVRITLPLEKWPETRRTLREMEIQVEEEDELLPWREAFPGLEDQAMPGLYLKAARHNAGLTQAALAERTGVAQHHLSEMENGKRPIGKKMARTLAEALKIDYRYLL